MWAQFPLLSKIGIFRRNPIGCVGFCCLALMGAIIGRAAFLSVYELPAQRLLAMLPDMVKPLYRPQRVLLYALLPPATYCAVLYGSGIRRLLLPIWCIAVLMQGVNWGVQTGAAEALIACGAVKTALLALIAPMMLLIPLYLYVALLAIQRMKQEPGPENGADALEALAIAMPPSVVLIALHALFATFACVYGMGALFD